MSDKLPIILEMFAAGATIKNIALEVELSEGAVRRALSKEGITIQKDNTSRDAAVAARYKDTTVPATDILKEFNISYPQLYSILARTATPTRAVENAEGKKLGRDKAISMYQEGYAIWKIIEETGISQPSLHNELHRRGIPLRRGKKA